MILQLKYAYATCRVDWPQLADWHISQRRKIRPKVQLVGYFFNPRKSQLSLIKPTMGWIRSIWTVEDVLVMIYSKLLKFLKHFRFNFFSNICFNSLNNI